MDMQVEHTELESGTAAKPRAWLRTRRGAFVLIVLLPTLLVLLYTLLIASSQYESKAQFIVRGMEPEPVAVGGLAQLVQDSGAMMSGAQRETVSIQNYLTSHEAIAGLKRNGIDIVKVYHKDGVDLISKLRFPRPRAETLLDYYQDHVTVDFNETESITTVSALAFDPKSAQRIADTLIKLGEARINTFNTRAIEAGQQTARRDLERAEQELAQIQGQLTQFRDLSGDLDSSVVGLAKQRELEAVEAELIKERSELASMRGQLDASSPLVAAAQTRVATLQRAVAEMRGDIAGSVGDLSRRLSSYEELKLKQGFAAKRYDLARAELEKSRAQAARQRLFLVPVVNANLPEKPLYPKPFRTTLVTFLALAIAFGIGWLLVAGIREHRAD